MYSSRTGSSESVRKLAAVLSAPSLLLEPTYMQNVLIYALCAAALGGLDSIAGAVVGVLAGGVAGGRLVYFTGDSGYAEGLFSAIGSRCGTPDLALIPIGAYEPRWFMKESHMNPAEAVRVHRDVGARRSIAMHWGTFQLTDEGREEPVRALGVARGAAGLGADDFVALEPGGSAAA